MADSNQMLQRRFGDARPGMQLLAIEDAAVPVTVVQTDVLAQERKELPIMEEFVLRLVGAGISDASEVAKILGLNTSLVLESAAIQVTENHLRRRTGTDSLSLTMQGTEVVRNLAASQPVLKQLPVVFDRLVWNLVDHSRNALLTKKTAEERGLQILPAARKTRIALEDVTAQAFNALLNVRDGRERSVEILRVRKVSPNTHRYLPVQLLVYGDVSRGELELALCIDGELRTDHGMALDSINAVEQLKLSVGEPEPRPILDSDLEEQRIVGFTSEDLPIESVSEQLLPNQEVPSVVPPVRSVSVFEHAELLSQALEEAKKRLLIISPWIRSAVVTTDFIAKLERRLRAGVQVTIAHGYGDDDSGSDPYALSRLENLASRFPAKLTMARLGNTHAKILIFDDQWVTTSFNWLSFRGDPERTYRMEEGTLVTVSSEVEKAYVRFSNLVSEQRVNMPDKRK